MKKFLVYFNIPAPQNPMLIEAESPERVIEVLSNVLDLPVRVVSNAIETIEEVEEN